MILSILVQKWHQNKYKKTIVKKKLTTTEKKRGKRKSILKICVSVRTPQVRNTFHQRDTTKKNYDFNTTASIINDTVPSYDLDSFLKK